MNSEENFEWNVKRLNIMRMKMKIKNGNELINHVIHRSIVIIFTSIVGVKLKAYQTRAKLVINHYLVGSLSVEVISFRQEQSIIGQCLVETISLEAIRLQTEMVIY